MTRQELIDRIAAEADVSKAQAGKVLDVLLKVVPEALALGDDVRLTGWGVFSAPIRQARTGRSPITGEPIKIAEKRVPKFSPGKAFKQVVNTHRTGPPAQTQRRASA